MTTAVDQFNVLEKAGDGGDYSSITDTYLEPLRLNWSVPDYSRLEKPPKPPVPEVIAQFYYTRQGTSNSLTLILDIILLCYNIYCFVATASNEWLNS